MKLACKWTPVTVTLYIFYFAIACAGPILNHPLFRLAFFAWTVGDDSFLLGDCFCYIGDG